MLAIIPQKPTSGVFPAHHLIPQILHPSLEARAIAWGHVNGLRERFLRLTKTFPVRSALFLTCEGERELRQRCLEEFRLMLPPDLKMAVHTGRAHRLGMLSPQELNSLFDRDLTPNEKRRLEEFGRKSEKYYASLSWILATKDAVLALLGLEPVRHRNEVEFRYGPPVLNREALRTLGNRGILASSSSDGDIGLGIAILESSPDENRIAGFGIDITTSRVRYTSPEHHALAEAAYKTVLPEHPIRRFGPDTAKEVVRQL